MTKIYVGIRFVVLLIIILSNGKLCRHLVVGKATTTTTSTTTTSVRFPCPPVLPVPQPPVAPSSLVTIKTLRWRFSLLADGIMWYPYVYDLGILKGFVLIVCAYRWATKICRGIGFLKWDPLFAPSFSGGPYGDDNHYSNVKIWESDYLWLASLVVRMDGYGCQRYEFKSTWILYL